MVDKNYKFVINTLTDWDELPRARHQVTLELSKRYKTVFINASHIGFPRVKIVEENQNLSILHPYFPVNYKIRYRIPIINEIYQIWLYKKIKRNYPDYQIINFDFSGDLINNFFSNSIYYCNDNYTAISKRINNYLIYKYHLWCEEKVAKNAAFCIVTSEILRKKLLKLNQKVYTISLGGPDIKQFKIETGYKQYPSEKIDINAGLVGHIREYNTSSQIINNLLKRGNITISLIGPVDNKFLSNLIMKDKIKTLGALVGKELYEAVNEFDVAIAPYHFAKFNDGGTPNKLLLYLALGKPVVITKLLAIEINSYPKDIVYFANDIEEFTNLVIQAYSSNSNDLVKKRISFADKNTWEKRIDKFIEIFETHKLDF